MEKYKAKYYCNDGIRYIGFSLPSELKNNEIYGMVRGYLDFIFSNCLLMNVWKADDTIEDKKEGYITVSEYLVLTKV